MNSHPCDTGKVAFPRQVAAYRRFICIQNPKKFKIENTYVFIAADPVFAGE